MLAPLLRLTATRHQVLLQAENLAREQEDYRARGLAPIPPAQVVQRLSAAKRKPQKSATELVIRSSGNEVLAQAARGRGGALTISVPNLTVDDRVALHEALDQIIDTFAR